MSDAMVTYRNVFAEVWDVVVFGGGYAGYAAATALHEQGKRVLLIDRAATPLWESAWAFSSNVGQGRSRQWGAFQRSLETRGAAGADWIDGAIAQVVASHHLRNSKLPTLFYSTPVAATCDDAGRLASVTVAAKDALRVVTARQWIDATEAGELARLVTSDPWQAAIPVTQKMRIFYRHAAWSVADKPIGIAPSDNSIADITFGPSGWENERALQFRVAGDHPTPRLAWLDAMRSLRSQMGEQLEGAVVTHGSVIPMPAYGESSRELKLAANVACAIPGLKGTPQANTLAGRFEIGLSAAAALAAMPAASVSEAKSIPQTPEPSRTLRADVVVAGIGTGGSLAAVAAGREGADVLAFDPLPFAGGIGTGGGIHIYYFGVKGGMQEELDQRTREIMPLFGTTAQQRGFHPDAKKIALEQMLIDARVNVMTGATLFGAECDSAGTITAAHVATEHGMVRIEAKSYIDGTGDADLAAAAGAKFAMGRVHDGQLHAFSQSSGRANLHEGLARMQVVNYDAGFVDPTDAQDLTRGRLLATEHYLQEKYTPIERPTYIAPAIGLRQGRQVVTDYVVTLADLIERRSFEDAVGLTGCHYDNHAIDYEFESDEAMFWVWCCRRWRSGRTGGQMPYRMMLPKGIGNLWIPCRGAGVSEEAHHSLRMQRDFQRLGEAAGIAAALASRRGDGASRGIDFAELRRRLVASGAMQAEFAGGDDGFGSALETAGCAPKGGDLAGWLDEVESGYCVAMYRVMRHGAKDETVRRRLVSLASDADAGRSFRAASILATWADASAEPRLLRAIESREYGFEDAEKGQKPETNNRLAPHWLVATRLLRICGTVASLKTIATLAADPGLLHNARTSIAITLEAIAMRNKLTPEQKSMVADTLRALLATPVPNSDGKPQRRVVETRLPGPPPKGTETQIQPVHEEFAWQLHLSIAKAEQAAGLPVHPEAKKYLADARATVRKAFSQVLQTY